MKHQLWFEQEFLIAAEPKQPCVLVDAMSLN
jgi:hypothetical protein